jgi:hypothetical protein
MGISNNLKFAHNILEPGPRGMYDYGIFAGVQFSYKAASCTYVPSSRGTKPTYQLSKQSEGQVFQLRCTNSRNCGGFVIYGSILHHN